MTTTDGSSGWHVAPTQTSSSLRIRAPGLQLTLAPAALPVGVADVGSPSSFANALAANALFEFEATEVTQARPVAGPTPTFHVAGSPEPHAIVEIASPDSKSGVIAYLEEGDEVTWLLPISMSNTAMATPAGVANEASTNIASLVPSSFTFAVPYQALVVPLAQEGAIAAEAPARKILRFLRFDWLVDVFQKGADAFVEWIASRVERRHKTEQLLTISDHGGLVPLVDRSVLRGGRSLLLVHGIFSSVHGAFHDVFGDVSLMGHLKTVYGNRIP